MLGGAGAASAAAASAAVAVGGDASIPMATALSHAPAPLDVAATMLSLLRGQVLSSSSATCSGGGDGGGGGGGLGGLDAASAVLPVGGRPVSSLHAWLMRSVAFRALTTALPAHTLPPGSAARSFAPAPEVALRHEARQAAMAAGLKVVEVGESDDEDVESTPPSDGTAGHPSTAPAMVMPGKAGRTDIASTTVRPCVGGGRGLAVVVVGGGGGWCCWFALGARVWSQCSTCTHPCSSS